MKTVAFGLLAAAAVALSAGPASAQYVVSPGYGYGGYARPAPGLTFGASFYSPGFGRSPYSPGYGGGYGGYRHPSYGFGHYDYVPGHFDRHHGHYDYHPGHYDYHAPGHRAPRH